MIKELEFIEIELYCLNTPITAKNNPVLIKNEINTYFLSSFYINKKKWNIPIPELNF